MGKVMFILDDGGTLNAFMKDIETRNLEELTDVELVGIKASTKTWLPGVLVVADELVVYNNEIYKVIQRHTTQTDWTPDIVSALFLSTVPEGVIPNWVQPTGAHDAYQIGDKVIFNTKTYESLINANTWSPTAYPAGWKLVV